MLAVDCESVQPLVVLPSKMEEFITVSKKFLYDHTVNKRVKECEIDRVEKFSTRGGTRFREKVWVNVYQQRVLDQGVDKLFDPNLRRKKSRKRRGMERLEVGKWRRWRWGWRDKEKEKPLVRDLYGGGSIFINRARHGGRKFSYDRLISKLR